MTIFTATRPALAVPASVDRPAQDGDTRVHDEVLMQRLSYRDETALETLYDRYGDLVYSTARRIVRDVHIAEDISQEVFMRLWRQPESYVPEKGRFVTWLLSVARNRALDWLRARRRRFRHETASPEQRELDVPDGGDRDPASSAELLDVRRTVKVALACLSAQQREVIELAYFGGLTQREVAERLGQPLGTVKTRIRAGMLRLREALRPAGEAHEGVLGASV